MDVSDCSSIDKKQCLILLKIIYDQAQLANQILTTFGWNFSIPGTMEMYHIVLDVIGISKQKKVRNEYEVLMVQDWIIDGKFTSPEQFYDYLVKSSQLK